MHMLSCLMTPALACDSCRWRCCSHTQFSRHIHNTITHKTHTHTTRYINKELLAKTMPPPGAGNMVFVCGPPVSGAHPGAARSS